MWGSAADATKIYVANNNLQHESFTMTNGLPCTSGMWFAINKTSGQIEWSVCNPTGGGSSGPVTVVPGGVVFVSSMDTGGQYFALNAANGAILWQYRSGSSAAAGAAIANGVVLFGTGYSRWGQGLAGNKLYAFSLNGSGVPAPGPPAPSPAPTAGGHNCWTCLPGFQHWFSAGLVSAPHGDQCACVPNTAPASTSGGQYSCWTCLPNYIHWFSAGLASAPNGDQCACVPKNSPPPGVHNCWSCLPGYIHWYDKGLTSAPGGDQCACVQLQ
jgi:hypothetical protein